MNSSEFQSVTFKVLGGDFDALNSPEITQNLLRQIAKIAQLTVLQTLQHQFHPQGISQILLLSESHLAIHTWPEQNSAYVTLTSCRILKEADFEQISNLIAQQFQAKNVIFKEIKC